MEHLKMLRNNKGVTQKDVAEYLGVDRTTYVKYERGSSEPNFDTIVRLAYYFGVSTDFLLTGRNGKQKNIPTKSEDEAEYYYKKLLKADKATQDIIKALLDKEVPD